MSLPCYFSHPCQHKGPYISLGSPSLSSSVHNNLNSKSDSLLWMIDSIWKCHPVNGGILLCHCSDGQNQKMGRGLGAIQIYGTYVDLFEKLLFATDKTTSRIISSSCVDDVVIRVVDRWQVTSGLFSFSHRIDIRSQDHGLSHNKITQCDANSGYNYRDWD